MSSENEGGIDKKSIFQLQFGCTCFHNFLATLSSFPANKRVIKAPLLELMKQKHYQCTCVYFCIDYLCTAVIMRQRACRWHRWCGMAWGFAASKQSATITSQICDHSWKHRMLIRLRRQQLGICSQMNCIICIHLSRIKTEITPCPNMG